MAAQAQEAPPAGHKRLHPGPEPAPRMAALWESEHSAPTLFPSQLPAHASSLVEVGGPSPGAINGSRVAARVVGSACEAYFAHGASVFCMSMPLEGAGKVDVGKEGMLLPRAASVDPTPTSTLHTGTPGAEVQALSLLLSSNGGGVGSGPAWLGSIDCHGRATLIQLPGDDDGGGIGRVTLTLDPPSGVASREAGWAGIALSRGEGCGGGIPAGVAATRYGKAASVYQDGRLVRVCHTLGHPTVVCWTPGFPGSGDGGGVFAVAEESRVTLWDVRQGERNGLIQALASCSMPGEPVSALAHIPLGSAGLLASAGTERAVVVIEPRRWQMVSKWAGVVKYPVTYLAVSAANPHYVYVGGLDYELVGGRWDRSPSTSGSAPGNSNSATGAGHGRAVGPQGLPGIGVTDGEAAAGAAAAAAAIAGGGSAGGGAAAAARRSERLLMSFRSGARWLGLAVADGSGWAGRPCDVVASY
ncbi:hypothetical protein FOA52_012229 [Chlamydomonas sp. UWO 241]|nr:hypothetical protein FOA52_012229 [Chlamydomonas sp. UWO 241]